MGNKGSKVVVEENALGKVVENAKTAVRKAKQQARDEEREAAKERTRLKKEAFFTEMQRRCQASDVKIQELTNELEELKRSGDQEKINEATAFLQGYEEYKNNICNKEYINQHYVNLMMLTPIGEETVITYPETPEEIREEAKRHWDLMTKHGGKRTRKGRKARRLSSRKHR